MGEGEIKMKLKSDINHGLHLCLVICAAIACFHLGAAYACEGVALEQTNTLYDHFQFANTACNDSGSVQDALNCMQEEWQHNLAKINALPEDCRQMLNEFQPAESTE